tara:strand:- start:7380 stop:7754 length:375 start_codon:yes stop_codon:yes gene_type:complete
MKTKLKKGQTVKLIVGVDKGKTGEIIKLFPNDYSALVKGINIKKKHQKPTKEQKGGIVNIEKPVHLSNLKVIDGKKDLKIEKKTAVKKIEVKKTNDKKDVDTKVQVKKIKKKKVTKKKTKKGKK